jgi:hypothetical protein
VVQAPTREPSDFGIAHSAEPALFIPEKTKRTSTPKRFLHMGSFAVFEVGFIGRVVWVRVTFDFNVSLEGCATGVAQPNLAWLPSSSHVSPKKDQSRPRCDAKYFCLRQRVFLFGCLRRAHRHRLEKIS